MPIFMDRHNIPGVTAKNVAEAHQMDLKVQDKYGCRGLTYWFDEDSGAAFCLIQAQNKNAVVEMHNNAHGLVPNQIIEVDSNLVKLFLGRITNPKDSENLGDFEKDINETGFRTIMDIELKNHFLSEQSKNNRVKFSNAFNTLVINALKKHDGIRIKDNYNGFIVSFFSTVRAVDCAIEIQKNVNHYNNKNSKLKIYISGGLNTGAPVTIKNSLFEEAIQLAKRLTYIASRGQILMSSAAKDSYEKEDLNYFHEKRQIRYLNPIEEKFLNQLMDTTEKVWNEADFNVNDFGKQIGFSKSQLNRKITSLTGRSPKEFIKEFRLKRALELIEKRQGNISEIAFESGFNSSSYFSKCFQKQFGVLPSRLNNTIK